ncbi:putative translation factor, partial [Rozella allomycis CSF55]
TKILEFPPVKRKTGGKHSYLYEEIDLSDNLNIKRAVKSLKEGSVVAIPTETVYGLAADAFQPEAVKKIFQVKNRPQDNPLIVHISSFEMLETLIAKPLLEKDRNILEHFWPGPLTVLFEKSQNVDDIVTCGQSRVAVRMPSHPIALGLISQLGSPLAAPSANLSGRPSPTTAAHVLKDLNGRIEYILDGGSCLSGLESTVLDIDSETILRPGGITLEDLKEVLPNVKVYVKGTDENMENRPATPGMKYRHYAPNAKVLIFENKRDLIEHAVTLKNEDGGVRIGLMYSDEDLLEKRELWHEIHYLGKTVDDVAFNLFDGLRSLDSFESDVILVVKVPAIGTGLAVMNRLEKAASS